MILRDVTEDDLAIFFEHQREPEGVRMAAFPSRDREAFFKHGREIVLGNPRNQKKTIVADGEVVGNVVAWDQDGKRLVGYWIGRAHWGKGIATAAVAELVARFETARPLYAYVAVQNVGSIRVLEKCGFRREGEGVTGEDGVKEILLRLGA
jgi:RimJ/RimL family protein N-acetyltransferase